MEAGIPTYELIFILNSAFLNLQIGLRNESRCT